MFHPAVGAEPKTLANSLQKQAATTEASQETKIRKNIRHFARTPASFLAL
jgi:hypothetical protein